MESGMPPTDGGTTPEGSSTPESGTNLGGMPSPSMGAGGTGGSMPTGTEITQDDKLWALLAYVLSPIFPVVIMAMPEKKDRPFLKAHNAQALVLGVIQIVLAVLAAPTVCITGLASLALFVVQIYWGVQAYNGKYVTIPVVTDFVKQQGWA